MNIMVTIPEELSDTVILLSNPKPVGDQHVVEYRWDATL